MTCQQARQALSAGEPGAQAHLAGCAACRRWADALATVTATAPALVPPAPTGLADRVAAALPPAVTPGPGGPDPATAPGPAVAARTGEGGGSQPDVPVAAAGASPPGRWRGAVAGLTAAATLVAVLGIAAVVSRFDQPPSDPAHVLAAAAEGVAGPDGVPVRFDIEGSLAARFPVPGADAPALPSPPALEGELDTLRDELRRFREQMERFGELPGRLEGFGRLDDLQRVEERLRQELERGLDARDRFRRELQGELERAAGQYRAGIARLEDELARLSGEVARFAGTLGRFDVDFDGSGAVDGAGRSRASIDYRIRAPVDDAGRLEVVTADGDTFVRTAVTGGWVLLDGPYEGFRFGELSAPRDLRRVLDRLRDTDGPVEDLGGRSVDGVRTRGFRLAAGPATVEAWVGVDDDRLYELSETRRIGGPGGLEVEGSTTFRFRDHGAPVTVAVPTSWVPLSELPPERRPPFSFSARIDLGGSAGIAPGPAVPPS